MFTNLTLIARILYHIQLLNIPDITLIGKISIQIH